MTKLKEVYLNCHPVYYRSVDYYYTIVIFVTFPGGFVDYLRNVLTICITNLFNCFKFVGVGVRACACVCGFQGHPPPLAVRLPLQRSSSGPHYCSLYLWRKTECQSHPLTHWLCLAFTGPHTHTAIHCSTITDVQSFTQL